MRDYKYIDKYLDELQKDIYDQPSDEGHTACAKDAIKRFIEPIKDKIDIVLDIGCGDGFCHQFFADLDIFWYGSTAGSENVLPNIYCEDMSFLVEGDESFDLVFARHVLEHSPMPQLTLMEWHRVSTKYALIILPAPEYWKYGGRNHYSIFEAEQWEFLFDRAGWDVVDKHEMKTTDEIFLDYWMVGQIPREDRVWKDKPLVVEYQYLLEKK